MSDDRDSSDHERITTLSRLPSPALQAEFHIMSKARQAAHEGDLQCEAAEPMRATNDSPEADDLEEDHDFFIQHAGPVDHEPSDIARLVTRNAFLRCMATQPLHSYQSSEGNDGPDGQAQDDPSTVKKPRLTSDDDDQVDLEIDDDFDFLLHSGLIPRGDTQIPVGHIDSELLNSKSAPEVHSDDAADLEMDEDFRTALESNALLPHPEPLRCTNSLGQQLQSVPSCTGPTSDQLALGSASSAAYLALAHKEIATTPDQPDSPLNHLRSAAALNPISSSLWASAQRITATTFDGRTIQLSRRKRLGIGLTFSARKDRLLELQKQSLDLLDEPVHRMLDKIRKAKKNVHTTQDRELVPDRRSHDTTLWTDRYRPQKFIDLIGDERVFRSAMSWLKEWDQCVFKNERSAASKRKAAKKRSAQLAFESRNNIQGQTNQDPLGRPQEKILLLCGAPGLGKTTMAHVLAHQAGYDIVEINASDDRTSKVVHERIKSALETRTLDSGARRGGGMILKDNRPTCVIIDEIDGAGGGSEGGFINALVKLVTDGSVGKAIKARGKKLAIKPLVRPIICICNDLYVPTLRPLRPISRIIRFATPTPMTLIKRLQTICEAETLKADMRNLTYLVKVTSGDLRSCLNTLQVVRSQTSVVSETAIEAAAMVGMKDNGTSVQSVLSKLFKLPRKSKDNATGSQLPALIQDISTCNEYDRIIQGCFETYPSAKQPTALWATYESVHDWLDFYDRLEFKRQSEQNYDTLGYVPYAIAAWRELLGKISNVAPDYPRVEYEMYLKTKAHEEVIASFKLSMPPLLKVSFMTDVMICELIPLLMRIISPDLRPVNSQLIRRAERDVMMRVVTLMTELRLKFLQDKGEDGQLTFVLDPPIDLFTQLDGKRPQDIPATRFGVRQMIAREMDEISIKRNQGTVTAAETGASRIMAAYKRQAAAPAGETAQTVGMDFFGRVLQDTKIPLTDSQGVPVRKKAVVLYRYHEGFSNAVKRPIKLSEFLMR